LPKIDTFLVDRDSSRSDALEGEPSSQLTQPGSINLLVSTGAESDSAVKCILPLTLTDLVDPVYTIDADDAVDSQVSQQSLQAQAQQSLLISKLKTEVMVIWARTPRTLSLRIC
jgi:hypothetical protein